MSEAVNQVEHDGLGVRVGCSRGGARAASAARSTISRPVLLPGGVVPMAQLTPRAPASNRKENLSCGRSCGTARRSDLAGWAEYGYCARQSRYFWDCICTWSSTWAAWASASP